MAPPPAESLVFKVHRREPQLIKPASPTPHEFKPLSDIDDQEGLRFQIPVIHFYRHDPSMRGKDPAKVIREALAKTLVFYYPFAGRLREGPNRKLVVECTGEGVVFIEADADVSLDQFGDALYPPFPCSEELLFDPPGSSGVLNCPLMLIQVTRLNCGGFIFALRHNHTMTDAPGLIQFLKTMVEMAHGAHAPSISPVWERHILNARNPPRITCIHHEYEPAVADSKINSLDDLTHRSFFFGPQEISRLRRSIPPHLANCSTFEVLTACLWRCRTIAVRPDPNEEMRIICVANLRNRAENSPLPSGYYGNAIAFSTVVATAGELTNKPLEYAIELVKKAKANVTKEYLQSVADLMVIKGRPGLTAVRSFLVSAVTQSGFRDIDFGWGKAAYAGPATSAVGPFPDLGCFYIPFKNKKGENGIVVPLCFATPTMITFAKELESLLGDQQPKLGPEIGIIRSAM